MQKVSIFWFRRDLRLEDNVGLHHALKSGRPVMPIFIFDTDIIDDLPKNDARISFIHKCLQTINNDLKAFDSSIKIYQGRPIDIWKTVIKDFEVAQVYTNKDYEPYAVQRDQQVADLLSKNGIEFKTFKDQVIFEEAEVLKDDGHPYTVFTPYKNKWLEHLKNIDIKDHPVKHYHNNFHQCAYNFPTLADIGFEKSSIEVKDHNFNNLKNYDEIRDFPAKDGTSYLSPHLRFGTVSIRKTLQTALANNSVFVSELVWREFFMQILFHFPRVVNENFKTKYNGIQWRNNEEEFKRWCAGKTGYPMVDAGMRQLNKTGYMHNRVRMITAGFLCKHLLIDWKWGEAYFAEKLLDYELSSNNGNWQWAAGTGCDAAPYFRVFNPTTQLQKFDPDLVYVRQWIKDFDELSYPPSMVDHKKARERALEVYKVGIA
ncbi:MAG: deoxyribodipyrimidine photo-lyase [Chitinophagales bacterium]